MSVVTPGATTDRPAQLDRPTPSERPAQLDRFTALSAAIPVPEEFLLVASLGGPAQDLARLTNGAPHAYPLGGAMGAAVPMALGLALARPDHRVIAVVGDGELLMSVGAMATAAYQRPPNLAIVCLDNARYVETGSQLTHTAVCTDLEQMAAGAGIPTTRTAVTLPEAQSAAELLRTATTPVFIRLLVTTEPMPNTGWELDGRLLRQRFRDALPPTRA
jgi:thiamine pyrophosphate-dependent acetolactate synthase large subunit-like protein